MKPRKDGLDLSRNEYIVSAMTGISGSKSTYTSIGSTGTMYTVTHDNGEWACSCPHWIYRRGECKHIKEVKSRYTTTI
jgi:hypothetical protein